MGIQYLYLKDFRVHTAFEWRGDADIILIEGANGAGKTSILETLSFLAPGKGLRNVAFEDAIRTQSPGWSAFYHLEHDGDTTEIGMACHSESKRRTVRIDGKVARSSTELLDIVKVIWLTPTEDRVLAESRLMRRKFIDRLTYNFEIAHAESIKRYEYYLRSRLKLLKSRFYDEILIAQLERRLAEESIQISLRRMSTIRRLKDQLNGQDLVPELWLKCHIAEQGEKITVEEVAEGFKESRMLDSKVGRSLYGVHRADFIIKDSARCDVAHKSSTGELKMMLLRLMMAQITSLNQVECIQPLLLLDDIFSHLDATNAHKLIDEFAKIQAQIWITGTNFYNFHMTSQCKDCVTILI